MHKGRSDERTEAKACRSSQRALITELYWLTCRLRRLLLAPEETTYYCTDWQQSREEAEACNVTTLMASMHPAGHQLSCSRPRPRRGLSGLGNGLPVGDGGGCIRLKCQLETMSMALGKASPRLGTRARGRACRRAACRARLLQPRFGCRGYRLLRLRCHRRRHRSEAAAAPPWRYQHNHEQRGLST